MFGVRYVGHDGGQQGTSTSFLIATERRAGVVVLANMEDVPANEPSKEMLKILLAKNLQGKGKTLAGEFFSARNDTGGL